MRTTTLKPEPPSWYLVDASGRTLGRIAARIAGALRGKHLIAWSPHQGQNINVIVVNADKIVLRGRKATQKEYIRHSGRYGHIRRIPFARLFGEHPTAVLTLAVSGMLPRNRLRERMLKNLHVYAGAEHPHGAQKPQPLKDDKVVRSQGRKDVATIHSPDLPSLQSP